MEHVPCTTEKHQYRREDKCTSSRGKKNCQRAEKCQRGSHAEDRRQVDRPDDRKTHRLKVTGQEVEHEVVLDIVTGKVRILGREIRTAAESRCDRHMRRKIAEDRESQTDGISAGEAGIEINKSNCAQNQEDRCKIEDH